MDLYDKIVDAIPAIAVIGVITMYVLVYTLILLGCIALVLFIMSLI